MITPSIKTVGFNYNIRVLFADIVLSEQIIAEGANICAITAMVFGAKVKCTGLKIRNKIAYPLRVCASEFINALFSICESQYTTLLAD